MSKKGEKAIFYKKHFLWPAFTAVLAICLLGMSEEIVKSQSTAETLPSRFKFKRLPAPKRDRPIAIQTDGKGVAAGEVRTLAPFDRGSDSGWSPNGDAVEETARLTAADGAAVDFFGTSVAISA